jgi:hypothetical protein
LFEEAEQITTSQPQLGTPLKSAGVFSCDTVGVVANSHHHFKRVLIESSQPERFEGFKIQLFAPRSYASANFSGEMLVAIRTKGTSLNRAVVRIQLRRSIPFSAPSPEIAHHHSRKLFLTFYLSAVFQAESKGKREGLVTSEGDLGRYLTDCGNLVARTYQLSVEFQLLPED